MPTIYIDNQPHAVAGGQNLLQACLGLGCELPYFCWHPALHSVGACRQCAVIVFRDEQDTRGQIVMSCMTPVRDGLRLSVDDPRARDVRRGVIELLMVGHPHDCPVCDEGGECHLQDMTVLTGHNDRRARFAKRTFVSQNLGPFVAHEMNRCIACYRCVRFYCDYAGGRDFGVQGWHDGVFFGRANDGALQSEFSGNLVEICPTGVFTDNTRRGHYTREWDLATAPSICPHCSLGCNTLPGQRDGNIRVVSNRYNSAVNRYFLCDRGRFGYGFARGKGISHIQHGPGGSVQHSKSEIRNPKQIANDKFQIPNGDAMRPGAQEAWPFEICSFEALEFVSDFEFRISNFTDAPHGRDTHAPFDWARPGGRIGIGSPRASVESNFALRQWVGADNFFSGERAGDDVLMARIVEMLRASPAPTASLHELDQADGVLVLGEDLTNTAPMAALAVRQASTRQPLDRALRGQHIERWQDHAARQAIAGQRGPIFICTPQATKLDDVARATYRLSPAGIAHLATDVAEAVTRASRPRVCGGVSPPRIPPDAGKMPASHEITDALLAARQPVIVFGTSLGSRDILDAADTLVRALIDAGAPAKLFPILPAANSLGLAMLSPRPITEALPWITRAAAHNNFRGAETPPQTRGRNARDTLHAARPVTLVAVEVDLFRILSPSDADALLAAAARVVVVDSIVTSTTARADTVLPAATVFESDGTFLNNEGRTQRFFRVCLPPGNARESWRWLTQARGTGVLPMQHDAGETPASRCPPEWDADGTPRPAAEPPAESLADLHAELAATVPALACVAGLTPPADFRVRGQRVPRQHHRHTGRAAMHANRTVHEKATPGDATSPLAFSMEGTDELHTPPALRPRIWSPGWNSVNGLTRDQEEIPRDAGTPRSTGVSPVSRMDVLPMQPGLGNNAVKPAGAVTSSDYKTLTNRHHGQDARGTHGRDTRATGDARAVWLLLPAWHIFGSEELSARAPAVAQRIPEPYIAVATADATSRQWASGDWLDVTFPGDASSASVLTLPLIVREELPEGVALLPAGLPALPFVPLPVWAEISKRETP